MQKVKFKIKADAGHKVFLAGSFNRWAPTAIGMKRNGDGYYTAIIDLPSGRHEYKFLIDGAWQIDQTCTQRTANAFGSQNSVIQVQ